MSSGFYSSCHSSKSSLAKVKTVSEKLDTTQTKSYKMLGIDSEFRYTDSTGGQVILQNSLPKAGVDIDGVSGYTDSSRTHYGLGFL